MRAEVEESWRFKAERRWLGSDGRADLAALVRKAWEAIAAIWKKKNEEGKSQEATQAFLQGKERYNTWVFVR